MGPKPSMVGTPSAAVLLASEPPRCRVLSNEAEGTCRLGVPVRECVIDIEMMSEVQMQSLSLAPHARVMCALPVWLCFRANRWELLPVAVTEHQC